MLTARNLVTVAVLVVLAALATSAVSLLRTPDSDGLAADSFGTRGGGYRAIFDVLTELGIEVERGLAPPGNLADRSVTLVLWAPDPNLVRVEQLYFEGLGQWLRRGGRVVVAPGSEDPRKLLTRRLDDIAVGSGDVLEELGLAKVGRRTIKLASTSAEPGANTAEAVDPPPASAPAPLDAPADDSGYDRFRAGWREFFGDRSAQNRPLAVRATGTLARLTSQVAMLQAPERLDVLNLADAEPVGRLTMSGPDGAEETLAAEFRVGEGTLLVVSDPLLLDNLLISRQDNSVLAAHLLADGGRAIVWDEFYHGLTIRGNPLWLLTYPAYATVATLLLLATAIWIWREAVFLGPPREAAPLSRRTVAEYVEAMARFLHRGRRTRRFVLGEVRDGVLWHVRRRLGLRPGAETAANLSATLARRDPRAAERLTEAMTTIDRTLSGEAPPSERATLDALRRLSECL